MMEHVEKLRATVTELEQELHSLPAVDDESRELLQQAMREIRAALHQEQPLELRPDSMSDRLRVAASKFEGSHPALTAILSRIIDGLGQMGI